MANKNLTTLLKTYKEIKKYLSSIAEEYKDIDNQAMEWIRPNIIDNAKELSGTSKELKNNLADFLQTANLSNNILDQYQAHLKNSSIETSNFSGFTLKAGSLLTKLGKSLASAGFDLAADAIISATSNLFTYLEEKEGKEAANAANMASSLRNSHASMAEGYEKIGALAAKYDELSKGVSNMGQNISLTDSQYSQYKQTISELSEIMPSLNTLFNEQGEKIGFAGGKIKDATQEYQKYIQTKAQNFLRDGDENGNTYQDILEDFDNSNEDNTYGWKNFWRDGVDNFLKNATLINSINSFREWIWNDGRQADYGSEIFGATEEYSEQEQLGILQQLNQSKKEDWSKILEDVSTGDSKKANLVEELLNIDVDKVDTMDSDEYEHLQEMVAQKISGLKQTLEGKAQNITSGMSNMLLADNDYWTIDDESIRSALSASLTGMNYDMLTSLGIDLSNQLEVETWVSGLIDAILENKEGVADAFKYLFSLDIATMNPAEGKDTADKYIKTIANTIYKGKASDDQITALKKSYGLDRVDEKYENYKNQINESFNNAREYNGKILYDKNREKNLLSWAKNNNVQENELEQLKNKGYSEQTSIDDLHGGLLELRKPPSQENSNLFDTAWSDTQKKDKEKLLELAKAGKLTPEVLTSSEKYASILKSVGGNAELATQKINKLVNKSSQLNAMKTGMNTITNAYSEKQNAKDNRVSKNTLNSMYSTLGVESWDESDLDVWEKYKKAAEDANTPLSSFKNAQDDLATSFINSNNFLSQLEKTNQDYYDDMLTDMGITNAHAVTTDILNRKVEALSLMKNIAKKEGKELSDVTLEEILCQDEYKNASEETKNGLLDLYLQENILNNSKLNMGQKIGALKDFITELYNAKEAEDIIAQGRKIYNDTMSAELKKSNGSDFGGASEKAREKEQAFLSKHAKKKTEKEQEVTTGKSVTSKTTTKQASDKIQKIAQKETKEEIDWIDRRLTRISSKLNLIKAAYENIASAVKGANLSKVVSKQNSNLNSQIKLLKRLENSSNQAASKYAKKANSVKISKNKKTDKKLKNQVKSDAAIGKKTSTKSLVKKYDKKTADKIVKYRDYYDKSQSAKQSAKEYKKQQTDAKKQQYQNLADKYQSRIDKQAARSEVTNKSKVKNKDLTLQNSAKQKSKHINEQIKATDKLYQKQKKIAELEGNNEEVAKLEAERRKKIIELQIQNLQNYADENEASYNLKATEASMTTDYRKKNQLSREGTASLKKQYQYLMDIAEKEGDITEKKRLQLEMAEKLNEDSKERVQNVIEDYENRLIGNNRQMQVWNNGASLAEAKGYTVSGKFYDQMAETAEESAGKHKEGLDEAWDQYYQEMEIHKNDPGFFNSQQWHDIIKAINSEADAWEQDRISAEKYKQQAIQAHWGIADSAKQAIDYLNDEAETYKSILGYKDMYDKKGVLTDAGTATFALDVYGIENNIEEFKKINEEIDELNELYKAGKISPEVYNKRMQELKDNAMSTVESIYSIRDSMKSLIEDGLNAEMDALNESIDKVKQNLSDASSLREYQKNIEKQTKNIASLERQISARSGDMSEKGRADVQKLKVQLENAKSELEDTEYDKYVEDQERILDDMSDDFQKYLDGQLDQIDELLNNISTSIQNGEANILPILEKLGDTIGVDLSKIFSENLSGFASTGKTDAGGVYENTKETYENSANEEFNQAANTPVMNTDENKGQKELNALAKDPAYQKTSAWLKSKGFSDNDVNRMYTSLGTENAQTLFTGIQNAAGSSATASTIFNSYSKEIAKAQDAGKDTPDAFSSYKETDAYAMMEERKKKTSRMLSNFNKVSEIAKIFATVRPYENSEEYQTDAIFNYGAQRFAEENGEGYNKYLSMENVKRIDDLVKKIVNIETGKPAYNTSNGEYIYAAIVDLDKQNFGQFRNAIKTRSSNWNAGGFTAGGFSKGGIIDSKTMSKIADNNGDDAWVTVKSGEGILSPLDTQNFLAFTDTVGKLNSSRLLTTENIMPRRSVSANNNVYGGVNIHLDGSDIKDFATFETAFQNAAKKSTKLRNTILDVATSGMTGDTNAFMRR